VGIAKGTVYLHFASKEDLLLALVERQLIGFLAELERASAEPGPVRARLERIFLDVFSRMQERRNGALLELQGQFGLTKSIIARRPDLDAQITRALARITALLDEGKRGGELDPAVPTPVMVATFVTLVSPSGYEQLLTSGQISPGELAAYVGQTFFPHRPAQAER
jgi:AcrR family transcriptional regulator